MIDLKEISKDIKDIISNYQKENGLTFIEDTHTYYIKDSNNKIISDMPSVSTVLKCFYKPFDSSTKKSFKNCGGDKNKEKELLTLWSEKGDYAKNKGSRVHYLLEQEIIKQYGSYKTIRKPIFKCDDEQISDGNKMINAGKNFINLMHERGTFLLDTEIILGSVEFKYFGQPDNVWIIVDKNGEIGIIITDWKTNAKKNFETQPWTTNLLPPFENLLDTALSHYYIQIPLYAKLLVKMLERSKYKNIKVFGGIVVLLKKDATFEEYRIPSSVFNLVMNMSVEDVLKNKNKLLIEHKFLKERDKKIVNQ